MKKTLVTLTSATFLLAGLTSVVAGEGIATQGHATKQTLSNAYTGRVKGVH